MKKITLGRTGLKVSPICYGCCQMGQTLWGKQPVETLIEAVHAALDVGVNFFDTSDVYGHGTAERTLGQALKGVSRDRFVVATMVGHHLYDDGRWHHPDLSREYLLKACEASLKRLGLDCIDLYQANGVDLLTPVGESAGAFEKLKKDGKIRVYGVSNFTVEEVRAARRFGKFETVQRYYNLLDTKAELDMLPYCVSEGLGVLVFTSLHWGMLTGKFKGGETFGDLRAGNPHFKGEQFREFIARVENLRPIAEAKGCTVTQLSLAATIAHPAIDCAIVGIKNAGQIREAAGAADVKLTREECHAVREAIS